MKQLILAGILFIFRISSALANDFHACFSLSEELVSKESIASSNKTFSHKPLALDDAADLFSFLSQRCELNFQFDEYGCNVRSYWMGYLLSLQNVSGGLVWIDLRSSSNSRWDFHVAPYAYLAQDEQETRWVFDPQLASRPLKIAQWRSLVIARSGYDGMESSTTLKFTSFAANLPPFEYAFSDPMHRSLDLFTQDDLFKALHFMQENR